MQTLYAFKDYLADRPTVAFLAIALFSIVVLFRKLERAQQEKVAMVRQLAPLTDKLCRLIERIGAFKERWGPGD